MSLLDYEINRALYSGPYGFRSGRKITILTGRPTRPFGRSVDTKAFLDHIPAKIYIAWRKGERVGQLARWACGGTTRSFKLTSRVDYELCRMCAVHSGAAVVLGGAA